MRSQLTITDLTRMQGRRVCVAGFLPDGTCIRPLPPRAHLTETWLLRPSPRVLRPFAVIEVELLQPAPDLTPPHTEDWEIELPYEYRGDLSEYEQYEFLHTITSSHVRLMFGTELLSEPGEQGHWLRLGTGVRSLAAVHLRSVDAVTFQIRRDGKRDYRLAIADEAADRYRLPVTDLAFRMYLDSLVSRQGMSTRAAAGLVTRHLQAADDVFLRLGLSRRWEKQPDRCYLQVNGIYAFPDYLDGRCFADFIESPAVDVPF